MGVDGSDRPTAVVPFRPLRKESANSVRTRLSCRARAQVVAGADLKPASVAAAGPRLRASLAARERLSVEMACHAVIHLLIDDPTEPFGAERATCFVDPFAEGGN